MLKIPFWSKETGNLMGHSKGLTTEQVSYLKSLKPGDRLILWLNETQDTNRANYTLKVYQKREVEAQ